MSLQPKAVLQNNSESTKRQLSVRAPLQDHANKHVTELSGGSDLNQHIIHTAVRAFRDNHF